jgi:mannitol-specific phosphotransferase system IIBC component
MNQPFFTPGTKMGTAAGTITIFLVNISSGDIAKTMVLAGIGAVVSFFISLLLRKLVRWWKERSK